MLVTPEPEMGRTLTWDAQWSWSEQYLAPLVKQKTQNDSEAVVLTRAAVNAVKELDRKRNRLIHSAMEPLSGEQGLVEWHGY